MPPKLWCGWDDRQLKTMAALAPRLASYLWSHNTGERVEEEMLHALANPDNTEAARLMGALAMALNRIGGLEIFRVATCLRVGPVLCLYNNYDFSSVLGGQDGQVFVNFVLIHCFPDHRPEWYVDMEEYVWRYVILSST